jgi:hypothetical protein
MNTPLMSDSHQASNPWAWLLAPGQATTLAAEPVARWLRVEEGCVWVTRRDGGQLQNPADDIWLRAGQSLALPAGTAWVIEGWPQARLALLLQAPAGSSSAFSRGGRAQALPWWQPSWLRAGAATA